MLMLILNIVSQFFTTATYNYSKNIARKTEMIANKQSA